VRVDGLERHLGMAGAVEQHPVDAELLHRLPDPVPQRQFLLVVHRIVHRSGSGRRPLAGDRRQVHDVDVLGNDLDRTALIIDLARHQLLLPADLLRQAVHIGPEVQRPVRHARVDPQRVVAQHVGDPGQRRVLPIPADQDDGVRLVVDEPGRLLRHRHRHALDAGHVHQPQAVAQQRVVEPHIPGQHPALVVRVGGLQHELRELRPTRAPVLLPAVRRVDQHAEDRLGDVGPLQVDGRDRARLLQVGRRHVQPGDRVDERRLAVALRADHDEVEPRRVDGRRDQRQPGVDLLPERTEIGGELLGPRCHAKQLRAQFLEPDQHRIALLTQLRAAQERPFDLR
jgi:hypothetical protein